MPESNVRFSVSGLIPDSGDAHTSAALAKGFDAKILTTPVAGGAYIEGVMSVMHDKDLPIVRGINRATNIDASFMLVANRSTWVDTTVDPYVYHNDLALLTPGSIIQISHRRQAVTGIWLELVTPEQYEVSYYEDGLGAGNCVGIYMKQKTAIVPATAAVNLTTI